jgi:membrane protein
MSNVEKDSNVNAEVGPAKKTWGKAVMDFVAGDWAWDVDVDSTGSVRRIWVNIVRFLSVALGGFVKNRCALHAAGLTYFSLLALVPALCLLMVLAKTCGAGDFARSQINGYFDRFIASVEEGAQPAAGAGQARTPAEQAAEEKRIAQHAVAVQLREFVNPLFDQIDQFDIRAFGWIGFAMLMWTIISSLGQIEATMNAIWSVSRQRHFLKRCWLYLFVVSVVPLLSAVALSLPVLRLVKRALDATMGATVYTKWASDALVAALDSRLFSFVIATVCVTLLFAFVLSFMPNRHVQFRASLEGGFLTAVLFCGWIRLCTAAQIGIGKSSAFYGSFASPMIVLAWLYMSWQIILLGANMTHAFQCVHNRVRDDSAP